MPLDFATVLAGRAERTQQSPILIGWVVGSTTTDVDVQFADGSVTTCPKTRQYSSPQPNDVVLIVRHASGMYAVGSLNAGPIPPPPPDEDDPGEPGGTDIRHFTFRPISTNTWRVGRGWLDNTTDLYQGSPGPNTAPGIGAAYYGNAPSGITGTAITGKVRLRRIAGSGSTKAQRPRLRLLPTTTRPSTKPTYLAATDGPPIAPSTSATVELPRWWITWMLTRQAGGIGIALDGDTRDPYMRIAGRSNWAPAMELTITYKRET